MFNSRAQNGAALVKATAMQTTTLVSDRDVARIFSWHRTTVWRNVRKGLLPQPIRIGRATRWNLAEIEALIQKLTTEQNAG